MKLSIAVPSFGESIREAQLATWHCSDGALVEQDSALAELESEKVTLTVSAPAYGRIHLLKEAGAMVTVGELIAELDPIARTAEAPVQEPQTKVSFGPNAAAPPPPAKEPSPSIIEAPTSAVPPSHPAQGHPSPAAERILSETGIPASAVKGTGPAGRITREDAEVASRQKSAAAHIAVPAPSSLPREPLAARPGQNRVRMSMLRRTIAKRLLAVRQGTAMLTTFNEIDMSAVIALRKRYKEEFEGAHHIGLGFMAFFVAAAAKALLKYPIVNASMDEEAIIYSDFCDIGIAVATEKGLVVPVLRQAQALRFSQIEAGIRDFAERARQAALKPNELEGGTFTITNGGVFGSLLSTPLINPPQSAILGMHNVVDRPIAVDGQVVVRPMMYVALSYDHRLIDGADAVKFLLAVKKAVEDPSRLLLDL